MRQTASRPHRICRQCGHPTDHQRVEHPYWEGTRLVAVVRGVPAWVCRSCGFHNFDSPVQAKLAELVQDYLRMGNLFPIPSTNFREV